MKNSGKNLMRKSLSSKSERDRKPGKFEDINEGLAEKIAHIGR